MGIIVSIDLDLVKQALPYLQQFELDYDARHVWINALFILYVGFGLQSIRRTLRRLETKVCVPELLRGREQLVIVRESELHEVQANRHHYDVPKVFPFELAQYVKSPTMSELAQWTLEVSEETNAVRKEAAMRAITVSAALHKTPIPQSLVLIDSHSKALWVRLKFDLELKEVTTAYVLERMPFSKMEEKTLPEEQVVEHARHMVRIGSLILKFSEKGDFPCFSNFVRILTGYRDLSNQNDLSEPVIQSLATAYAVKSGLKIPVSYINCDFLTLQLMGYSATQTTAEVVQ